MDGCAPSQRGKIPLLRGGRGAGRARGGELEDGEMAETPPDRAYRGKSKRKRGAGTGGGGELFCASEGEAFDTAARGQAPPAPQKPKSFPQVAPFFCGGAVPFFGLRVP